MQFRFIQLLVLLLACAVQAQTPDSEVATSKFNPLLLEEMALKHLNQVRASQGLEPMVADKYLRSAANTQATHCLSIENLAYEHGDRCLKYASDRIANAGGRHTEYKEFLNSFEFGGLYAAPGGKTPISVKTYDEVGKFLVSQWLRSDWQLEALMRPYFTHFALGIARKPSTNKLYFDALVAMPPYVFPSKTKTPENLHGLQLCDPASCQGSGDCCQKLEIFDQQKQKGNIPHEVGYGLYLKGRDIVFFFNDKRYWKLFFVGNKDGVAIDIVHKDQFTRCGAPVQASHWAYQGLLLRPVYNQQLLEDDLKVNDKEIHAVVGQLPADVDLDLMETRLMIISQGHICKSSIFSNVQGERWKLLDSGMYLDSLREDLSYLTQERQVRRELEYIVPFQKGNTEFDPKDLRSVKSLLQEGDFELDSVIVHAYASVEGSKEANMALAEKRGDNIYQAINAALKGKRDAVKEIVVDENWAEFYRDVLKTPYSHLSGLSKSQVKDSLAAGAAKPLESILEKHRKGIITLVIKKVDKSLYEKNPDELKVLFGQAIDASDAEKAQEVLNVLFGSNLKEPLPEKFLDQLEIPQAAEYGSLLGSRIGYQQMLDDRRLLITLKEFKELAALLPNNGKIEYNLCVTRLRLWLAEIGANEKYLDITKQQLLKDIEALKAKGIDKGLVQRLKINYKIIQTEEFMYLKEYEKKNKALDEIFSYYPESRMSNANLVQLAKFYAGYSRTAEATELLLPHVTRFNPNEEVMFYFLNLTISKMDVVDDERYRSILVNAMQKDADRLRTFFKNDREGVTFQLLKYEPLKKFYCDFLSN